MGWWIRVARSSTFTSHRWAAVLTWHRASTKSSGRCITAGGSEMVGVGSSATHDAIVKYKPLIGLHGHIHESKGIKKISGVPVANPGSEYGEGVLDGLIVDIDRRKGIKKIQLVAG